MTKFWEGLAGQLGKDWALQVLTPAFVFWATAIVALSWHVWGFDAPSKLTTWVKARSAGELGGLILIGIAGLSVSAWVADRVTLRFLRVLEGYWPDFLAGLRTFAVERQRKRFALKERQWRALAEKMDAKTITNDERMAYAALDYALRRYPLIGNFMPTGLGNTLRAAETWPEAKYGLGTVVCWPRLWLLLSKNNRNELIEARSALDSGARVCFWSVLSLMLTPLAWWVCPAALVAIWLAHRAMLAAADSYGALVEAVFDVRRNLLYDSLAWPRPLTPAEEQAAGHQITIYLSRGSASREPLFTHPAKPTSDERNSAKDD